MMTNIFAQFMRPPKSVAEYDAEYDIADGNKLALAAKRLQMQQAERGMADDAAMRSLAAQHGGDTNALVKALYGGGYLTQAQGLEKSISDQLKAKADIGKTNTEAEAKRLEMASKRLDIAGQAFGFVRDNPTPENAQRVVKSLMEGGIWNQQQAEKAMSEIMADPSPQAIGALATQAFQQVLSVKEQLPNIMQQNRGGTQAVISANPISGQVTDVQSATVTESEPQRLTREQREAEAAQRAKDAAAGRGVQIRGQDISRQNTLDRMELDNRNLVMEGGGPDQVALSRKFGKAEPGRRWKPDGSLEPIPGSSADLKSGVEGEKRALRQKTLSAQADSVLDEIAQAKKLAGWNTTGVAGVLSNLPMTDARKLAGHVETIKANLGFDRLQQMRDMSPTGGALGQVAVQELNYLQATVSKLDQLQKPSEVIAALDKIERSYKRWKDSLGGATGGANGSFDGDKSAGDPDIDALLKKYGGKK